MQTNEMASVHLGKTSKGSEFYNPSLLVAVLREENRTIYNIDNSNLPFFGCDIWHAYEFSTMTENGIPFTGLLKIKYDAKSPYIIESKSLKLYLNSYNMSKFGSTTDECLRICQNMIKRDLSQKLETKVDVEIFDDNTIPVKIFDDYTDIMSIIDEKSIFAVDFKENPKILQTEDRNLSEYKIRFSALRSNCRVTHQPDFADIFIYYKSKKHIKEDTLLKYLISFRSEYHFHEECVEMVYKRLFDILNSDDELFVCALYTRRGGIDINPVRYSKNCTINDFADLIDLEKYTRGSIKQ